MGPIASVFHRLLCGRFEISDQDKGSRGGESPLPGSDPIEASRRRYDCCLPFLGFYFFRYALILGPELKKTYTAECLQCHDN